MVALNHSDDSKTVELGHLNSAISKMNSKFADFKMARENTVSFKVFLQSKDDEKPEVRRFGVDRDAVSNFTYVSEKLQNVFPALRGKFFNVSWKDGEGDDVIISTDDELMIALTEMPDDVHKLYVTIKECGPKENPSKFSGTSHGDVVCDVCDKDVVGFRYKCLECSNYDLCAHCESKGYHPEHFMVRLPVPVSWRPHFGKRLAHHLTKSVRRCNVGGEETFGAAGESECPFVRHGCGRGRSHGNHGNRHSNWQNIMSLFGDLMSQGIPNAEGTSASGEKAKEKGSSTLKGETQPSEAGASKNESETCTENQYQSAEYLINVGRAVASFLDPLGIDVDFKVERNKVSSDSSDRSEEKTKKNVSFADDNEKDKETPVKNEKIISELSTERESPEKDGWTVVHEADATSQEASATRKEETQPLLKIESSVAASEPVSVLKDEPSVSASATTSTSASTSTSSQTGLYPKTTFPVYYPPAPSFTNIPAPFPPPPPMGPPQWPIPPAPFAMFPPAPGFPQHQPQPRPTPPPQQQQPTLGQATPFHRDPKINQAVEAMMSMGFSNDGGWLTQLVEMKNGDIGKVLDLLQPVKRN